MMAATARPAGVEVSTPFPDGPQDNVAVTELSNGSSDLGNRSTQTVDRGHDDGVAGSGVVEERDQSGASGVDCPGEFVGVHPGLIDAGSRQDAQLSVKVLADGAHPRISKGCRHSWTVSLKSDIEDLRRSV